MRIRFQALGGLASTDLVTELELPEGARVKEAVQPFCAKLKEVPYFLFLVNGKRVEEKELLHEGDSLVLFPPVVGG